MKKYLWMAALASVALAGCVSEEVAEIAQVSQKKKLSFGAPVMYNQSRAHSGEIAGTVYPTSEEFKVYGFKHTGNFSGWGVNKVDWGFSETGEIVKNRVNTHYWDTDKSYYLPSDSEQKLSFLAYSPYRGTGEGHGNVSVGNDGLTITDWVMQDLPQNQYDLMCSVVSPNVVQAEVPITFYHALSSIHFTLSKAVSEDGSTPFSVKLKKLSITGDIFNKGTFKQNLVSGADVQGDPAWRDVEKTDNAPDKYVLFSDVAEIPKETDNAPFHVGGHFLPIPQTVNSNMIVEISYEIIQEEEDTALSETLSIPFTSFIMTNGSYTPKWEMSTSYIYHIHFGDLTRIYFAPVIGQEWITVDNAGVYTVKRTTTNP